ncbi:unnamed protein product, partial [Rotaria sp. Silwood2]
PVDTVVYFSGTHEKRGLSFGIRQMIFKELLKERVKRNIRLKSDKQEMLVSVKRQVDSTPKPKPPQIEMIKLQPKVITPNDTNVTRDFFAKFKLGSKNSQVKSKSFDQVDSINKPIERKALISFAYNEGFSDAIRCKIKIQDLL